MSTPIPPNDARFALDEVLAVTGGRIEGPVGPNHRGFCGVGTDSRRLRPGEIFVALRGERHDGHAFVAAAAAAADQGLILVDRDAPPLPPASRVTRVRVADTLVALGALAARHLGRWREGGRRRVLAVTGSAGKTTTKAAMGAILSEVAPGAAHVTRGNLNNRIGVPLTILGLEAQHRFAVLEMGTSEQGEIPALARLGAPDVAMVTLISDAHTEGLGGIEGVRREKLAMFGEAPRGAIRIGNADDARVRAGLAPYGRRAIGYGTDPEARYRVVGRGLAGALQRTELLVDDRHLPVAAPLYGAVGALSVAGAVAGVEALLERPVTSAQIEAGLRHFDAGRRFQIREVGALKVIDDSYNANPASCAASLETAAELAGAEGRALVAVLGEMRELGEESPGLHRRLGVEAARRCRHVIAVGGDARHLAEGAREAGAAAVFVEDAEAAVAPLRERLEQPADLMVLVKASRSIRAERVVEALLAEGRPS
ncbi:MAG: UDP-N-acetylmuramoyl-tripeptide--D-alanyl-D-alanine ligase [Myxococcota bacterium]